MNENTKNKFAEILAAAQAKANVNPNFKDEIKQPAVLKVIPEIKEIQAEIKKVVVMPSPIVAIAPVKPEIKIEIEYSDMQISANGEIEEKAKIIINDYSEKAIVLTGETYPIRKDLKALGAIFSYNFKCGAGWMFSKKRFNEVKGQLQIV